MSSCLCCLCLDWISVSILRLQVLVRSERKSQIEGIMNDVWKWESRTSGFNQMKRRVLYNEFVRQRN